MTRNFQKNQLRSPQLTIANIRNALSKNHPRPSIGTNKRPAAVAIIIQKVATTVQLLFIERTKRKGDPWSGHIAFPGGKVENYDRDVRNTAERETLEEIGINLHQAEYLGRLKDLTGNTLPVQVSGFVYYLGTACSFTLSSEIKNAFWIPISALIDPEQHTQYCLHHNGKKTFFPAINLCNTEQPVLWGITYRFAIQLLSILNLDIPQTTLPLHSKSKEELS